MDQSNSYIFFKKRIQEIFDFAVLVTASVPTLKLNLKLYKDGKINRLPDPDYFEPSVVYEVTEQILSGLSVAGMEESSIRAMHALKNKPLNNKEFKEKTIAIIGEELYKKYRNHLKKQSISYVNNIDSTINGYQTKLATYLYFSAFSYFEAYIIDLSREVISFFDPLNQQEYLVDHPITKDSIGYRIKLNKITEGKKKNLYEKLSKQLNDLRYKTPEEVLFASSIKLFEEKINNLQANDVPAFLKKFLLFDMSEDDVKTFHSIRDNRNKIGHGEAGYSPNLRDVTETNKFYKRLSSEIDKHVLFHFSKLRNYIK